MEDRERRAAAGALLAAVLQIPGRLLAQEQGRVVRRAALLGLLLGAPDAASPRLIDTYVKSIRKKLGSAGSLIETVRGVGYRLASDSPS